jgi:signal peptidase II
VTEVADQSTHPADHAAASGEADSPDAAASSRKRRPLVLLVLVAILVLVVDLITKQLVLTHLREDEPARVIPGVLYFDLIRNSGAAFSFGTNHTWIFPTITIVVIGWIAWMAQRLRSVAWSVAFGLVLGGALGNLADRLFRAPGPMRGEVVDFVSLFSNDGRGFAIFNIADSALSCGVALAILLEVLGRHRDGTRHAPAWRQEPEVRD